MEKLIYRSAESGNLYAWTMTKESRTAYAKLGDPSTRFERYYFDVKVYEVGTERLLNFGFINTPARDVVELAIRHPDVVTSKLNEIVHEIEHPAPAPYVPLGG